jgi:hypothetical protein
MGHLLGVLHWVGITCRKGHAVKWRFDPYAALGVAILLGIFFLLGSLTSTSDVKDGPFDHMTAEQYGREAIAVRDNRIEELELDLWEARGRPEPGSPNDPVGRYAIDDAPAPRR